MKFQKFTCTLLASLLVLGAAGCSQKADDADNTTNDSQTETDDANTGTTTSSFDFSASLDENGFFTGVTASDYVTLADYSTLVFDESSASLTDEDVQQAVDDFMAGFETEHQILEGEVQNGDVVNIAFEGSVNGVAFQGGTSQSYDLTIGSHSFVDDFEEQLIGHSVGDEVDVRVTFPDGYQDSTDADGNPVVLAGQEVDFKVTINYISQTEPAQLTEDFVKDTLQQYYGVSTVDELYDYLRTTTLDSRRRSFVEDYLMNNSTFADELPAAVTDYTRDFTLNYARSTALNNGYTDVEAFLIACGFNSTQDYLDQQAESITYGAKYYLVLQALAEQEGLQIQKDDIATYFNDQYSTDYSEYESEYGYNYLALVTMQNTALDRVLTTCEANTLNR